MSVSLRSLWVLVALGAVLSGCALPSGPSVLNRPAATTSAAGDSVVVRPGDTLYAIAQRFGVSPRALIDANRLRPPYLLRVGDRLVVPSARVHVVRRGDTVSEIAEAYGVSMRSVVVMNNLRPPYLIRIGDRLRLPSAAGRSPAPATTVPSTVVAARTPRAPLLPPPGPQATRAPRASNQPWSSGGQLHFPVQGQRSASAGAVPLPVPRPSTSSPASPPATAVASTPTRQVASPPSQRSQRPSARTVALSPPPKMGGGFRWPVEGRIISGFGPREGGLHNDGVNILAAAGTQVRAAENGIVVYAGNELRGFGNLLLIKHANDWTTAYAHADRLLVGRGDKVTRGQPIATVGQTGNVSRPQLHFEIRKGPRPVDPRKELPPLQVSELPRPAR